jgi:hypothetical protein
MSSEVAVTLPGDIPGLLRPYAPVIVRFHNACVEEGVVISDECVTAGSYEGYANYVIRDDDDTCLGRARLSLILNEPAGRDIAVRWMAEKLGLEVGLTAPSFFFYPAFNSSTPGMTHRAEVACWILEAANGNHMRFVVDVPDSLKERRIPGLPLDPDQGIEALRLCVLHLAGRL